MNFSEADNCWYADCSVPRLTRKLKSQGWEITKESFYDDGTPCATQFKGGKNLVSIRNANAKKRTMSDEQRAEASERLSLARNNKANSEI